jgi:hypothetical protein
MGGAGQSLGRGAGSVAGKTIGATGRGVAGAVGGGMKGTSEGMWGAKAPGAQALKSAISGGLSGASKGAIAGIRGRKGALSQTPPKIGSGMRISDSFKAGGDAATKASKVSEKASSALSETVPGS